MIAHVLPIAALLLGATLFLLGSGLTTTLLALRASFEGFSDQTVGLIGTALFIGYFIGIKVAPDLIRRMGHIRAANLFAAAFAALVLLHPLNIMPWLWFLLRVLEGIVIIGFYSVVESWVNAAASAERRGSIFAVYMTTNLFANAAAQQGLHLAPIDSWVLFSIAAIGVCLSILPIAATRLRQPEIVESARLPVKTLFQTAPAALMGILVSGLMSGAFWSLSALYATRRGWDTDEVARWVSLIIIGGAVLQLPLGKLSDAFDRRWLLGLVASMGAVASMVMISFNDSPLLLRVSAFFYGGTVFALYSISIAHLIDRLPHEQILAGSTSMLMLYGLTAMIGPTLAGTMMTYWGPNGWPAFSVLALLPLAGYAFYRTRVQKDYIVDSPAHFVPLATDAGETALEIAAGQSVAEEDYAVAADNADSETEAAATAVAAEVKVTFDPQSDDTDTAGESDAGDHDHAGGQEPDKHAELAAAEAARDDDKHAASTIKVTFDPSADDGMELPARGDSDDNAPPPSTST